MVGTYGWYLLGALYIVAPVIAWTLFAYGLKNYFLAFIHGEYRVSRRVSWVVLLWMAGMLVMLLSLWVGHIKNGIGLGGIIKSTVGWAKGWALLAIFPFIGTLNIRPELIYRAGCIVGLHTIILFPVFFLAWVLHLPQMLYISPLKVVGGSGPEFFAVVLYELEPGTNVPRWRLFTPWAPAAGFVANIYFIFALNEKDPKWKWIGIAGAIVIVLMSKSRLALVSMGFVPLFVWGMMQLTKPWMLYVCAAGVTALGTVMVTVLDMVEQVVEGFKSARAESSRVRSALGRIAVHRWRTENYLWGNGVVERGPHLVEYMPIGSHHTWYGLLFVKGIVGFYALAVPMFVSFWYFLFRAYRNNEAKVGFSIVLILFLYTFGENLEVLSYLTWPGLLFIGLGSKTLDSKTGGA